VKRTVVECHLLRSLLCLVWGTVLAERYEAGYQNFGGIVYVCNAHQQRFSRLGRLAQKSEDIVYFYIAVKWKWYRCDNPRSQEVIINVCDVLNVMPLICWLLRNWWRC